MTEKVADFTDKEIRRTLHNNEWWFVVKDVVMALTNSVDPTDHIKKIRCFDKGLANGWGQIVTPPFN